MKISEFEGIYRVRRVNISCFGSFPCCTRHHHHSVNATHHIYVRILSLPRASRTLWALPFLPLNHCIACLTLSLSLSAVTGECIYEATKSMGVFINRIHSSQLHCDRVTFGRTPCIHSTVFMFCFLATLSSMGKDCYSSQRHEVIFHHPSSQAPQRILYVELFRYFLCALQKVIFTLSGIYAPTSSHPHHPQLPAYAPQMLVLFVSLSFSTVCPGKPF
jgi:hypothetical protein